MISDNLKPIDPKDARFLSLLKGFEHLAIEQVREQITALEKRLSELEKAASRVQK